LLVVSLGLELRTYSKKENIYCEIKRTVSPLDSGLGV
jgi:hypothetical protein